MTTLPVKNPAVFQPQKEAAFVGGADPRWQTLYRFGGLASIAAIMVMVLGVIGYIIWPYAPGVTTTEQIFEQVQKDWLGALIALDFLLLIGNLTSILLFIALYVALRQVHESYALIALVIGLLGLVMIIPSRPIAEIFSLSNLYTAAVTDADKSRYLAAGETLLTLFNGTAWITNILLGTVSLLISSILMLRSPNFGKWTAWMGIVTSVVTLAFVIPGLSAFFLFLSMPLAVVWDTLLARRFFQLAALADGTLPAQSQTNLSPGA